MENNSSSNSSKENAIDSLENLELFTKNGMQSLMELIKASNNLPIEQWEFLKTFPEFSKLIGPESQKILEILNNVLHHLQIHGNVIRRDDEEKYDKIIEANDTILERVDSNLDELQGLKKNPDPIVGDIRAIRNRGVFSFSNRPSDNLINSHQPGIVRSLVTTRLNVRPQIKFKDKIDNRNIPFEPRIKNKPNALKPLAILLEKYDDHGESYSHPYEYELDIFKPPEDQLLVCEPQNPKLLNEIPLILVDNLDNLNKMMEDLKRSKEMAVDVEHHSYRSFQGFTCLVQISTRDIDYIVDTLELRSELHVLNEVFTDPKIVKVFHGADHDIEWLQRDLSVYVVNMFDTYQAAQLLNFPRLSLAHLLKVYCNVDCNKEFQLYDWRTRPLPEEAIKYAREDTHYLLYVYDMLKNALIEKANNKTNLLENVITRSTDVCKKKYWKNILTEDSCMEFYRKTKKMFDNKQMYAFKHLYQWRDKIAREEDESVMYVLPNHMLVNIAENLPREIQGISALCNPVPPLVKQHEREIHAIIFKAREQPLVKPIVKEGEILNQSFEVQPNWVPVNVDSKLYCPHDLSHFDDENRKDLPTLLDHNLTSLSMAAVETNSVSEKKSPAINVLSSNIENDNLFWHRDLLRGKERQWKFVSPYQRYQKVIAFTHSETSNAAQQETSIDQSSTSNDNCDEPSPAKIPRLASDECSSGNITTNVDNVLKKIDTNDVIASSGGSSKEQVYAVKNAHCASHSITSSSIEEDNSSKKKKKKKKTKGAVNRVPDQPEKKLESESSNDMNIDVVGTECTSKESNDLIIPKPLIIGNNDGDDLMSSKNLAAEENLQSQKTEKNKSIENIDDSQIDKKKVKLKDDFKPYNYNDVDFSRFQSLSSKQNTSRKQDTNKKSQVRRTPWLGSKKVTNIKKTISGLKK